jgi:nicotinamidase-related amidase
MELPRRDNTVVALIDMQERLLNAFPEATREAVTKSARTLLLGGQVLGLPVVVSEQYPKGLGPTLADLREAMGPAFRPIEKLVFSCGRSPEFRTALAATARRDVIVAGVEAHVCVLQTVLDLTADGYRVYIPADAVASRRASDADRALALMQQAGAIVGTTELFLFHLLERAGTDEFKQISRLVK